ncbi:hypothetical protein GMLC_39360 [Geomonas limicola]|uniref:diguanylate cyclase n=1 Tax=Geomonas limicola TaxID=2740186 RepID=A0A6V8NEZ9_9BACT|nr:hypothetical protein GMLC_39360 [Geomonas limicola]
MKPSPSDVQLLNEARFLAAFCCAVFGERDPKLVCATAAQWLHRYFGFSQAHFAFPNDILENMSFPGASQHAPAEVSRISGAAAQPRRFSVPAGAQDQGYEITVQLPTGLGTLRMSEAAGPRVSTEFLSGIGESLAAALEKAREYRELQELSLRDALTGLLNRRAFEELLEIEEGRREERPQALIMIDIDDFKALNDTFGHPAGDQVIAEVAGVIRDALRGADLATRYGGEEFAVLLPGTRAKDALRVAERIRSRIANLRLAMGPLTVQVSASLGVASRSDKRECTLKDVLAKADQALYRAKRSGKNVSMLADQTIH